MTDFKRGITEEELNGSYRYDRNQHFSRGISHLVREPGGDQGEKSEKMETEVQSPKNNYLKMVSVTQILSVFSDFSSIPDSVLDNASKRGSRVHNCCALYMKGIWVTPMKKEWQGYFESFKLWANQYIEKVFFVEEELSDPHLGFFGHPDMGVQLIDGFDFKRAIIDLKTPATESKSWRAQTAGYLHLANLNYGPNFFDGNMALQLRPDGKMAKALPYKNKIRDFTAFMAALNCYRYFKL